MHRARQHGIIVPVSAVVREVSCSLAPDRINNPPADGLASPIARLSKLFRSYRTFYVSLIAVAFQHQVGDAPDVNFRDHAQQVIGQRCMVNPTGIGSTCGKSVSRHR